MLKFRKCTVQKKKKKGVKFTAKSTRSNVATSNCTAIFTTKTAIVNLTDFFYRVDMSPRLTRNNTDVVNTVVETTNFKDYEVNYI